MASARAAARLARTNTAASVQRALLEPTGRYTAFGTDQATGILSSTRRFADGALALEAYLEDDPPPAPPEARTLAVQLDATFDELACAAREHRAPGPLPPLRQTQQALAAVAGQTSPLAEETDRMVQTADRLARPRASPDARRRGGPTRRRAGDCLNRRQAVPPAIGDAVNRKGSKAGGAGGW